MKWTPTQLHDAILKSDVNEILFKDPLSEETRKGKRHLLIAGFTCLLIAVLKLEITGVLGLSTNAGSASLSNALAQGLACVVVVYMLVGYLFHVFVDYSAWKFERERMHTAPYVDLIHLLESSARTTGEQITNAFSKIPQLAGMQRTLPVVDLERQVGEASIHIANVNKHLSEVRDEIAPLIKRWRETIESMDRLTWRLSARFMQIWVLDIALPVALAGFAIYKTYPETKLVLERLLT